MPKKHETLPTTTAIEVVDQSSPPAHVAVETGGFAARAVQKARGAVEATKRGIGIDEESLTAAGVIRGSEARRARDIGHGIAKNLQDNPDEVGPTIANIDLTPAGKEKAYSAARKTVDTEKAA